MFWRRCPCFGSGAVDEKAEAIKVLDYGHLRLENVPSEVFLMERTLEELYLDSNLIRDLPRQLFHCTGLLILSISDNDIQILPQAVAALINLEKINLSKNGIIDIPEHIRICSRLKIVDLSTNPLAKLPEGVTQLLNLQELYLNDTFLEFLPANFGRLARLQVLELRENHLKTLPKSLNRLTELRRLDIGQNDLVELPEVIGEMSSLSELWCDNNRLQAIPSFIGNLKKLTYLDASNNRIEDVADEFGDCELLSDITFSCNKIATLPDSICRLKNLVIFRIDKNELSHLPKDMGNWESLEELIVNCNCIKDIPSSIGFIRSLQTLIVDSNDISQLPHAIGSCIKLRLLSLSNNSLTYLPDEIGRLSCLKVLNLSGNQLQCLPLSLAKLHGVKALWLSDNQQKPVMTLQQDVTEDGTKVLTCFLLPQQERDDDLDEESERLTDGAFELSPMIEERQIIKFTGVADIASDDQLSQQRGLLRNPTPYPKELKAHAKHARNLAYKQRDSSIETPDVLGNATNHDDVALEISPSSNGPATSLEEPHLVEVRAAVVRAQPSAAQSTQKVMQNNRSADNFKVAHRPSMACVEFVHNMDDLQLNPCHVQSFAAMPSGVESKRDAPSAKSSTLDRYSNRSGNLSELQVFKNLKGSATKLEQQQQEQGSRSESVRSVPLTGPNVDTFQRDIIELQMQDLSTPKSRKTLALDVSQLHTLNESTVVHVGDESNLNMSDCVSPQFDNSLPLRSEASSISKSALRNSLTGEEINSVSSHYASSESDRTKSSSYSSFNRLNDAKTNVQLSLSPIVIGTLPQHLARKEFFNDRNTRLSNDQRQLADVEFYSSPHHEVIQHQQKPLSQHNSSLHSQQPYHHEQYSGTYTSGSVVVKQPQAAFATPENLSDDSSQSSSAASLTTLPQKNREQVINFHTFPVVIVKHPDLGFAVAGGLGGGGDDASVYVSSVTTSGPASTALKVGDRILRVDDIDLCNVNNDTAKAILQSTGPIVSLLVRRNAVNSVA